MLHDPFDIDRDDRTREALAYAAKIEREKEIADVAELLKTPFGRRFIWRQLCLAGVYRSGFSTDHSLMARAEGRREMGLSLLADVMDADPDAYSTMSKEQKRG